MIGLGGGNATKEFDMGLVYDVYRKHICKALLYYVLYVRYITHISYPPTQNILN